MVEAFRWILEGRLAGSAMPGHFNALESDLADLRSAGVRHVISLTETPVRADPGGDPRFHHFPIKDMDVPTPARAAEICRLAVSSIESDEAVLIHCRAGLGRTGTLLACCLITLGSTPERALREIRTRCSYYVQTEDQERFLWRYTDFLRASRPTAVPPRAARPGRAPPDGRESPNPSTFEQLMEALTPALDAVSNGITLAAVQEEDMPLIYVNQAFERITGYSAEEVLGRNCRFLQGPETDPEAVFRLRAAIREGRSCHLCLRNYRKDGTTFLNELKILPVGGEPGHPIYFIGVQNDVTALLVARAYQRRHQATSQVTDILSVEHLGASFDLRLPHFEPAPGGMGVLVADPRGQIRYADPVAGRLLGADPTAVQGANVFDHLDADWLTESFRPGTPNAQNWLPARLAGPAASRAHVKAWIHRLALDAASPLFALLLREDDTRSEGPARSKA